MWKRTVENDNGYIYPAACVVFHVVRDTVKEELEMDKPLKDWTLAEAQAYCSEKEYCSECELAYKLASGNYLCAISDEPAHWNLSDRPKYTADEVALAKLLIKAGAATVVRNSEWLVQLGNPVSDKAWWLPAKAFPSLQVGQIVDLKDIAESEARDG